MRLTGFQRDRSFFRPPPPPVPIYCDNLDHDDTRNPPTDSIRDKLLAMSRSNGKTPSMLKTVSLILACALSMIVNVSLLAPHSNET